MTKEHDYCEPLSAIAYGIPVQWKANTGEWLSISVDMMLGDIANKTFSPLRYRVHPDHVEELK